jgi:MFS family permease
MVSSGAKCWQALLGGFLVHMSLGVLFLWGNISAYVTSWIRLHQEGVTYADTLSVFAAALAGQACVLVLGGKLQKWVGLRITSGLGGLLVSLGTLSASWCTTVAGYVATYGFLLGAGVGLAYTPSFVCCYRWLPLRKGLASGIIVSAFGLGTLVFDTLSTSYVNPENLAPTLMQEGELYYGRRTAERVPGLLVLLSACHLVLTSVGSCLLRDPDVVSNQQRAVRASLRLTKQVPEMGDLKFIAAPVASPSSSDFPAKNPPVTTFAALRLESQQQGGRRTTVKDMIQSPLAWHLATCFVLTGTSGLYVVASYKEMAQAGLDDAFLSWVGSMAALAGSLGRLMWGCLADEIGFEWALMIMSMSEAMLLWFYSPALAAGRGAYAAVTTLLYATHGGNYAIYPVATANLFGESGQNYALLYTAFGMVGFFVLLWFSSMAMTAESLILLCWMMQLAGFASVVALASREQLGTVGDRLLSLAGMATVSKSNNSSHGKDEGLRISVGKTMVALSPPPCRAVPLPKPNFAPPYAASSP